VQIRVRVVHLEPEVLALLEPGRIREESRKGDRVRLQVTTSFRPMVPADVGPALRIISAHDSDDAEVAEAAYEKSLAWQYAFCVDGELPGVTGGTPIDETDDSWWLSWTYLDAAHRGQGLGREMLGRMLEVMRRDGARKVFLTTSSLRGRDGRPKYAAAIRASEAAGFEHELRHADFYTPGEAMLVMGLRMRAMVQRAVEPDAREIRLGVAHEIGETDDTYALDWQFVADGSGDGVEAFETAIEALNELEARIAFVGLPSDARAAMALTEAAGFHVDGTVRDFYADGVDEIRWRLDLEG
jgi:GNAT superfamily N-acetyltransferase